MTEATGTAENAGEAEAAVIPETTGAQTTSGGDAATVPAQATTAPTAVPTAVPREAKVYEFGRSVTVIARSMAMLGISTQAAGGYTIQLGNPIWTDTSHTQFQYSYATVDTKGDNITVMTVTVSDGSLSDADIQDARFTDLNKKSATWIFDPARSQEEIQQKIRSMTFTHKNNLNVDISIDGNPSSLDFTQWGIDETQVKLTQWTNGHYYMYVPYVGTWSQAYNVAKSFTIGGRKGYMATADEGQTEMNFMLNVRNSSPVWIGASMLKFSDGTEINDADNIPEQSLTYAYSNQGSNARYFMTWNCGPATGYKITDNNTNITYGNSNSEPNNYTPAHHVMNTSIQPGVQSWESCMMYITNPSNAGFNDIWEGNYTSDQSTLHCDGLFVEFGGYTDPARPDPGQRDDTLAGNIAPANISPRVAEATINGVKYAPVSAALEAANAGDTVVIVNNTVEACTDQTLKSGVTLQDISGNTYKATTDTKIDIDANGSITIKDGILKLSRKAPLKVYNPVDKKTYDVIAPNCESTVNVDQQGDEPYIMGETNGTAQIGAVSYTYENPAGGNLNMISIPDAMLQNDLVTRGEVPANETVTIKVDTTDAVELQGGGQAAETVTVRRKTDGKAEVKLPADTKAKVFGHVVTQTPAGSITISQEDATDSNYPDRDYVLVAVQDTVEIDGITYDNTAGTALKKFYLGQFQATIDAGANAELDGTQPDNPGYLQTYTVTFQPADKYELIKDSFVITMKTSDTGKEQTLDPATVCTEEADGKIKVTIPEVTGDISIQAAAKHQMTSLKVTGLGGGTYTAEDAAGNIVTPNADGEVTIELREEVTLKFFPKDFSNPYYSDLTGEQGESFSILTALTETTNNAADLFQTAAFDWTEKSYTFNYTPQTAVVEMAATFTPSHITHVHVQAVRRRSQAAC